MMTIIMILAAAGCAVAIYAFTIEQKVRKDRLYKPMCDISDKMSCTKPILSKYGNILGISNALVGVIFYAVLFVCAFLDLQQIVLIFSWAAVIASVIMAYILYVKIKTICLLCTTVYIINGLLLAASYWYL